MKMHTNISHICRMCLKEGSMSNIFNDKFVIAEQIMAVLSIEVSLGFIYLCMVCRCTLLT